MSESEQPPYEDPELLARLRVKEDMTQPEIADELGCSVGTISLKLSKYSDEIDKYEPSDFDDRNRAREERDEVGVDSIEQSVKEVLNDYGVVLENTRLANGARADLAIDEHEIAVFIADGNLMEAIGQASICGYKNACVAVSDHRADKALVDKITPAGPGLFVVEAERVRIDVDPSFERSSGVKSLLSDEVDTFKKYNSEAWLKRQIEAGEPIYDIAEECSVQPWTIVKYLDRYSIPYFGKEGWENRSFNVTKELECEQCEILAGRSLEEAGIEDLQGIAREHCTQNNHVVRATLVFDGIPEE